MAGRVCLLGYFLLILWTAHALLQSPEERQQLTEFTCGPAHVRLQQAEKFFDLQRACELYGDLAEHHIFGVKEIPEAHFWQVRDLGECKDKDLASYFRNQVVACGNRKKNITEIFVREDDPRWYVMLLLDGMDYANQLFLNRKDLEQAAANALEELKNPELKRKNHYKIDWRKLKEAQWN